MIQVGWLKKHTNESVMEATEAIHGKVKELRGGPMVVKEYHYLPTLLEKDPSKASLL